MAQPLNINESNTIKDEYIKAYVSNGGYSYAAAKQVGVNYTTVHYWIKNDPEFNKITDEVKGLMLDAAESELYKRAIQGKERDACLLFYLKTKGKERGYVERQENTNTGSEPMKLVVEYKANETDAELSETLKQRIVDEYLAKQLAIKGE
jgi:transposase-like protein